MSRVEAFAAEAWRCGRLLALGGDHSITAPVLRGRPRGGPPLTIVHFDAHADLYPEFEGSRDSHACPFHRVMEEGLAGRLVQLGVRTMNSIQAEAARRFGVEIVPPDEVAAWPGVDGPGPIYVSFDMDALDPAFAPGVSHHEPGGLTTRQALQVIQSLKGRIVGLDIVELNPTRDPAAITAAAAFKILKETAGRIVRPA
jgi:agmatinase